MKNEDIIKMAKNIIEATKRNKRYYIEIEHQGATVIQMGEYRIITTHPPFSETYKITITRPIKNLNQKNII